MMTEKEIEDAAREYADTIEKHICAHRSGIIQGFIEATKRALSMSGVSDSVRDWVEKHQREAWDKMGDTGNDQYQENINQENYWFGYFRALEDFESEFLEKTDS